MKTIESALLHLQGEAADTTTTTVEGRIKQEEGLIRRGSFTEAEAFFLHKLLVDEDALKVSSVVVESNFENTIENKVFDDSVLFAIPPQVSEQSNDNDNNTVEAGSTAVPALPSNHKKAKRRSILGLWQAHALGFAPSTLLQKQQQHQHQQRGHFIMEAKDSFQEADLEELVRRKMKEDAEQQHPTMTTHLERQVSSFLNDDANSEAEVRPDAMSKEGSSWDDNSKEAQFDTWEVLRDEYSEDFGYDYNHPQCVTLSSRVMEEDISDGPKSFQVLGTFADDVTCHPHVLSPPLMHALMKHFPTELQGQNFWLRYSLVRDGASLDTFKQYVRAAPFTLIAIETPNGQVFGSFTSSTWKNRIGFFGGQPAFVWKMKHSRRTKCASLLDQARMESEIDVYKMVEDENEESRFVQVCHRHGIAVGGDDGSSSSPITEEKYVEEDVVSEETRDIGFAISLEEDLMGGTTSPSLTFQSPALHGTGDRTKTFDVAGLEVWSFTPCSDVLAAEKLEMTKFFIEGSIRESTHQRSGSVESYDSLFSSQDLVQRQFYRRVGDDMESEERRQRWQYVNMMNPGGASDRGFGASPRFVS